MANICPQCGAPAQNGATTCQYCGAAIPAEAPAAAAQGARHRARHSRTLLLRSL